MSSTQEILAGTARELRLPLSNIKGCVSALLRTDIDWDDETRKELITEIDLETDRLAQLVESQLAGHMPGVGETAADQNSTVSVESQVIVLALSKMLEAALMIGAARVDTMRYLLNETNPQGSWQAIKAAFAAQVHLSPEPVARLAREILAPERPEQLTDRELEVLRLVTRGWSNKQIARDLAITLSRVKTHVTNILGKLGVESRTQAALHAGRTGLVPLHELASTGTLPA